MPDPIPGPAGKCPTTGKKQYADEHDAHQARKSLRKRKGPRTRPYQCVYCHMWHIGHWRPPQRRKQDAPWKAWPKPKRVDNSSDK